MRNPANTNTTTRGNDLLLNIFLMNWLGIFKCKTFKRPEKEEMEMMNERNVKNKEGGRWGSNPRPSEPQSDALTS